MTSLPNSWTPDTKFIEIGVHDDILPCWLHEQRFTKYLGVSHDPQRIEQLRAAATAESMLYVQAKHRRVVLQNNADVLILSGKWVADLWNYRRVRHAPQVAVRLSFNPLLILALLGWLFRWVARQYKDPEIVTCCDSKGRTIRLLVSRVSRVRRCHNSARHFIPCALGVRGFLAELDRLDVHYAVLRWFDQLDKIDPSKDIDILIADEDHERVMALFASGPGIQQCDTYTPSGLPLTEYAGVSYYPPHLANQILDRAVMSQYGCRVPCPEDHFHSLIYHAVIHKGPKSGLPGAEQYKKRHHSVGRDFTPILTAMAAERGVQVEITLAGLFSYLEQAGWGPATDLLTRLAAGCPGNQWLATLARQKQSVSKYPNLSVFVIRADAHRGGHTDQIIGALHQAGFELLATKVLTPAESAYGAVRTRGGNWGPGAGYTRGGVPAVLVIAHDPQPLPLTRRQRKRFPLVSNARQFVKEEIRDSINARLPAEAAINALHSSDYAAEAEHFIEVFAPELKEVAIARLEGREIKRKARRAA